MKRGSIIILALLISLVFPLQPQETRGKILIDVSHSSQDIEKIFNNLVRILEINNYYVVFGETIRYIDQFDVLVIAIPTQPFTTEEVNSIHQFVNDGGGLLFMGEGGALTSENVKDFNVLAKYYGIEFQRDVVVDPRNNVTLDQAYPEIPLIGHFADHPVTKNVKKIFFSSGCSLRLSGGASPLAWGGEETYGDRFSETYGYRGGSYEPGSEKRGEELIVIAYTESGKGRVVALGDTSLFRGRSTAARAWPEDPLEYYDNKRLALNTFDWLSLKTKVKKTSELLNEMTGEARYLIEQGEYQEALDVLTSAKSMSLEAGDSSISRQIISLTFEANKGVEADNLLEEGKNYLKDSNCEDASESFESARSLYESIGNMEKVQECLTLLSECGNSAAVLRQADLLFSEGKKLSRQGKYSEALETVKEAREIYESLGANEKAEECAAWIEETQDYEQKKRQEDEAMKRNRLVLAAILGIAVSVIAVLFAWRRSKLY